jgi:hypothetical protein
MSYYWQYEERCWVINHLDRVTPVFRKAFVAAYEAIFQNYPEEIENYRYHGIIMRRVFGRWKRRIPLLHRNGKDYQINPANGELKRIQARLLPKYGPYEVAARLPFPDEMEVN